ncbi:TPA: fimbria/pilus outer membrane usher protein [Enterobacter asburiae]
MVNSMRMSVFRHTLLAAALGAAMREAAAEGGQYFNPAFLADDPAAVADLSRFERAGQHPPGTYRMDLVVNGTLVDTRDITFEADRDGKDVYPCISLALLEEVAVNMSALREPDENAACMKLSDIIPDATTTADFEKLRLDLSIPQARMNAALRGYIPPSRWDDGIPAVMLNYQYSGSHASGSRSLQGTEQFLSLQSGINAGPWRLRDHSTVRSGSGSTREWQHISTTLERAIIPWRASMAAGDTWTGSDIFDTVRLRGLKLGSDDAMLPDSMRGFAPTVRGIARTAARVTVSQNGYEIYQAQVQPGAFEFSDLYTTSTAGDLTVTIHETDGRAETYTVPYSAVPVLRREGQLRYEMAAGKVDGGLSRSSPQMVQGTVSRGLPAGFTAYGGVQLSGDYRALAVGAGSNMGRFGAISADLTQAWARHDGDETSRGQSLRFLYARSLNELGTSFQLTGYRYSTEGFYTLNESTWKQDAERRQAKKGRAQVSISQRLPSVGSLYLSGSQQTYWNSDRTDRFVQAGINGQVRQLSWNLAWSESRGSYGGTDRALMLGFSVPLGSPSWDGSGGLLSRSYGSWSMTHDMAGRMQNRAGLSGAANDDGSMSYSLQQTHDSRGSGQSGSGQLTWNGPYASMTAGAAHARGSRQVSGSLSGSVLAHAGGVTFGQQLGESSVLIDAGGAAGLTVENMPGVATDGRGHAVVPWASAFRENRVALNLGSAGEDTDVEEAVQNVVPTRGAVVKASFSTRSGQRMLVTLTGRDGRPVPFGSMVTLKAQDERKPVTGIAGEDGQVYLAGMPPSGELEVVWGAGPGERCAARVSVPEASRGLQHLSAACS